VSSLDTMPWLTAPRGGRDADWVRWADALPMSRALGLVCAAVGGTEATFGVATAPFVPNPNGAVHGGIVATIADQAMAVLAIRVAEAGHLPATASLTTLFLRPAFAPLTVVARLLGGGRSVTYVEAEILARDGRRCATGQATMIAGASRRPAP